MTRIPHTEGVLKAIRQVRNAAQHSLKALNQVASQRMRKGDYENAEAMADKGREIQAFFSEVDSLRKKWSDISRSKSGEKTGVQTPLWKYYQPVLQAIVQNDGKCVGTDVENTVGRMMKRTFQAKDFEMLSGDKERWRIMVRRTRRCLTQEGWLEDSKGKMWIITEAGRRAAESEEIQKEIGPN